MFRNRRRRGQSAAEYIILAGLLVAGLAGTLSYFMQTISHFSQFVCTILGLPVL